MTTASRRPRATTVRTILTRAIVLKLRREGRPVGVDATGIIRFALNASIADCIVWDGPGDAPACFGVRMSVRKTCILPRRVYEVFRTMKVANVSDLLDLPDARGHPCWRFKFRRLARTELGIKEDDSVGLPAH